MYLEIIPGKVAVKIYNRLNVNSTHYYSTNTSISFNEVYENHNIICSDLSANKLMILKQIHGNDVVEIDKDRLWNIGEEPKADAHITDVNKIALGILTADCVPVLIASMKKNIIAAAHCGWRSSYNGILTNIKNKIKQKDDSDLIAVIGPSILQSSYEVDEAYYQKFLNQSQENSIFFIRQNTNDKYLFDLPGYIINELNRLDIKLVHHFNEDTYLNPLKYPSHRYSTHLGEKYQGNILSTIIKF